MHLRNFSIRNWLVLSLTAFILFDVTIGGVAIWQADRIHEQTRLLYNHPLTVRTAIGVLRADLLTIELMHRNLRSVMSQQELLDAEAQLHVLQAHCREQVRIFRSQYLGPASDVDTLSVRMLEYEVVQSAIMNWHKTGDNNVLGHSEVMSKEAEKSWGHVMRALDVIDRFARGRARELYQQSEVINADLQKQMATLLTFVVFLSVVIGAGLIFTIKRPLGLLLSTTHSFREGELGARCNYPYSNEFGVLATEFNALARELESSINIRSGEAAVARVVPNAQEPAVFFQQLLGVLMSETRSQMGALYLRSNDGRTFTHHASIGLHEQARASFDASTFEGEFGRALQTRSLQHITIRDLDDTRLYLETVGGSIRAREILTLPVVISDTVIAVVSLATTNTYDTYAISLTESVADLVAARVDSALGEMRRMGLLEKLHGLNRELEVQSAELRVQADELSHQNIVLEEQKQRLDEANRLKTTFISTMSHELRTPLNSVIGLSGVLTRKLEGRIPDEEYSYLHVIMRNGKRLLALINNILDIARVESGYEHMEYDEVDLCSVIREVVELHSEDAREKNITMNYEGLDSRILLWNDPEKLKHVLHNLLANAVKFTEQGSITVTLSHTNDTAAIAVCDTGIGIAAGDVPFIFDEFRQADASASRRYGGSGLGLSIAKRFVSLLGGELTVTSEPGVGSTFTLTLPIPGGRPAIRKAPTSADGSNVNAPIDARSDRAEGYTLLLVDDTEAAIVQLQETLAGAGYNLLIARNGEEALAILRQTRPDGVILDLMMPKIDGFQVLGAIRENEATRTLPVIILTAKEISPDELQYLRRNHVIQLIQKGDINREELLSAVAAITRSGHTAPNPAAQRPVMTGTEDAASAQALVLIVEDQPDNLLTLQALLADTYRVLSATDGPTGLALAGERRPDIILLDIALPGMTGIEVLRHLREHAELRSIPVIAVTASATVEEKAWILSHGFDGYIAKPVDATLLLAAIHEALNA
ncbi:MAG: response regulator [Ignavibacteriae bacterium]|nr:response regulator [Ignavibacteriota bacterium]